MRNLLSLLLLGLIVVVALAVVQFVAVPYFSGGDEAGCPPYPKDAQQVADTIGGRATDWAKSDHSWTYKGSDQISYVIPTGCGWELETGNKYAGEEVILNGGETITWP